MISRSDFTGAPVNLRQARKRARVSDHALLRYLERVLDLPVEQIRAGMLTDTVVQAMAMNATSVRGDGFKLIIDNFNVITAVPTEVMAAVAPGRRREIER